MDTKKAESNPTNPAAGHDQDSDAPRTAVPPDSSATPGGPPAAGNDPTRDPDSDPPRTPVPARTEGKGS